VLNPIIQAAVDCAFETEIRRIYRKWVGLAAWQDEVQRAGIAEKALYVTESAVQQPFGFIHLQGCSTLRALMFDAQGHAFLLCNR